MINSLSKIAIVVGAIALLPTETVNAQLHMTRMPTRLEEVLINPDLREVLIKNTQVSPQPAAFVAAPRVASLPKSPVYLNEPPLFSPIKPKPDTVDLVPSRLPSVEQAETPSRITRRPADPSLSEEVTDAPPAILSQPGRTAPAPIKSDSQPEFGENLDLQKPLAPIKGQLRFRVTGVAAMIEGQPADVLIEVFNPASHAIGPVEVNVKVPQELTITRFDRDAWLDSERRIIAFRIERVEPEAIEKIAMKGVSNTPGKTSLDVALLSGETMVAQRIVETQVFPQQVAQRQTFGDTVPTDTLRK